LRYLIDGHNLIPHIPGLTLEMLDDEVQLVQRLQEFCRLERHQAEVYFDGTPPEHAGRQQYGPVMAVFVRKGLTADEAIRRRLRQLGVQAKQWTLVSSDQAVLAAGREVHAAVMRSEEFARKMEQGGGQAEPSDKPDEGPLNPDEVDEWLNLFRFKKQN
jgi:predicted RNA-binding protein with PIN domain